MSRFPGGIELEIDDRELRRMLRAGVREYELGTAAALNRAVARIRTYAVRVMSRRSNIPIKKLRSRTRIFRARRGRLSAAVRFHTLPMIARHLDVADDGAGTITVAGHTYNRAFPMPEGKVSGAPVGQPFQRRGRSRLPITRIKVPLHEDPHGVIEHGFMRYSELLVNKYLPGEIMWRLNRSAGRR